MFLIVFTTLVMSVLGLFTQVVAVQNARIYNAENALVQNMLVWHSAAISMVNRNSALGQAFYPVAYFNVPSTGKITAVGGAGGCIAYSAPAGTVANIGFNTTPPGCPPTSPTNLTPIAISSPYIDPTVPNSKAPNYAVNSYSFYSTPYQDSNAVNYVLTFVPVDNLNRIILSGSPSAFTSRNVYIQMQRAVPPNINFGTVTALGTLTVANATGITYAVPNWVPINSIGVISPLN